MAQSPGGVDGADSEGAESARAVTVAFRSCLSFGSGFEIGSGSDDQYSSGSGSNHHVFFFSRLESAPSGDRDRLDCTCSLRIAADHSEWWNTVGIFDLSRATHRRSPPH